MTLQRRQETSSSIYSKILVVRGRDSYPYNSLRRKGTAEQKGQVHHEFKEHFHFSQHLPADSKPGGNCHTVWVLFPPVRLMRKPYSSWHNCSGSISNKMLMGNCKRNLKTKDILTVLKKYIYQNHIYVMFCFDYFMQHISMNTYFISRCAEYFDILKCIINLYVCCLCVYQCFQREA